MPVKTKPPASAGDRVAKVYYYTGIIQSGACGVTTTQVKATCPSSPDWDCNVGVLGSILDWKDNW